jgi:hypothetical protein
MRKNPPLPDRPPALTGDHEADADAAVEWLFRQTEQWLAEDQSEATDLGGYAA